MGHKEQIRHFQAAHKGERFTAKERGGSLSKEQVLEYLGNMKVREFAGLLRDLLEPRHDIILTRVLRKLAAIKAVRSFTSFGLWHTKALVENVPHEIRLNVSMKRALQIKALLEDVGCSCEIVPR